MVCDELVILITKPYKNPTIVSLPSKSVRDIQREGRYRECGEVSVEKWNLLSGNHIFFYKKTETFWLYQKKNYICSVYVFAT